MSRFPHAAKTKKSMAGLALTWDGARWPLRSLPSKARSFLEAKTLKTPAPNLKALSKLLAEDNVQELRICWVPRLKGGEAVLAEPFVTLTGKRLTFRAVKTVPLDDNLGVVYRRKN